MACNAVGEFNTQPATDAGCIRPRGALKKTEDPDPIHQVQARQSGILGYGS